MVPVVESGNWNACGCVYITKLEGKWMRSDIVSNGHVEKDSSEPKPNQCVVWCLR